MPDFLIQWVYAPSDFNTAGSLDAVPNEAGAQAAGTPPWELQLNAGAGPNPIIVNDDDTSFNEIGDAGQVLVNPVTIGSTTYPAGSRVVINYVITTDDGFEGYSITIGDNNSGNNTTTAFITNTPMVPGQTYTFTSEANIGNRDDVLYPQFACFTSGTLLKTPTGDRPIQDLVPGDLVLTRDNGPMPIHWVGQRTVPGIGPMAPIVFEAGEYGATRTLTVSPNHRMLLTGAAPQLCLGLDEVLVAAKALTNGSTIYQQQTGLVTYVHVMFESHQIVCANGSWSESFFAGGQGIGNLQRDQQDEVFTLFPVLAQAQKLRKLARSEAKLFEGRVLAAMH